MPENNGKFTLNKKYLTICLYGIAFVLASVIIIKAIVSWSTTTMYFKKFMAVLSPFIWGAFIAFLIYPMVKFFEKSCFGRIKPLKKKQKLNLLISILISYVLVLAVLILVVVYLVPQIGNSITDIINKAQVWYEQVNEWLYEFEEDHPELDFNTINTYIEGFIPQITEKSQQFVTGIVPVIFSTSISVVRVLLNVLISIMVSIYIIVDRKILLNGFNKILYGFLPQKKAKAITETLGQCGHIFSKFVSGKAVDSIIIGCLCFIVMTILQFPFAPIISLIVGITNMIPYFGPFIGAVPGIILIFMVSPLQALFFAIIILVLQQFDGLFLGPRILGDSVGLRPLWIIFAITVGGSMGGVVGMFLGVPVVAVIAYLIETALSKITLKKNGKKEDAADTDRQDSLTE